MVRTAVAGTFFLLQLFLRYIYKKKLLSLELLISKKKQYGFAKI